jgi:hypothetical protein
MELVLVAERGAVQVASQRNSFLGLVFPPMIPEQEGHPQAQLSRGRHCLARSDQSRDGARLTRVLACYSEGGTHGADLERSSGGTRGARIVVGKRNLVSRGDIQQQAFILLCGPWFHRILYVYVVCSASNMVESCLW